MSPYAPLDGTRALPEFVELDLGEPVDGVGPEDVKALQTLYREHCEVSNAPIDLYHGPAPVSSVKDVPPALVLMDRRQICEEYSTNSVNI